MFYVYAETNFFQESPRVGCNGCNLGLPKARPRFEAVHINSPWTTGGLHMLWVHKVRFPGHMVPTLSKKKKKKTSINFHSPINKSSSSNSIIHTKEKHSLLLELIEHLRDLIIINWFQNHREITCILSQDTMHCRRDQDMSSLQFLGISHFIFLFLLK